MDRGAWEAAGLYDPDAPGAVDRLALLEHLATEGVTLDEMVDADARGALPTAYGDKVLRGDRTLTAVALAEDVGVPLTQVQRLWMALGLPVDDALLPAEAVAMTALLLNASKTFGEDAILGFARVMAGAAAQVAEAACSSGRSSPGWTASTPPSWRGRSPTRRPSHRSASSVTCSGC